MELLVYEKTVTEVLGKGESARQRLTRFETTAIMVVGSTVIHNRY